MILGNLIYILLILTAGAGFLYWFTGPFSLQSKAAGCFLYIFAGWLWSFSWPWKLLLGEGVFHDRLDFPLFHFFFLIFWLLIKISGWYRVRPILFFAGVGMMAGMVFLFWDYYLMPFFLSLFLWVKFPLIPLSLTLMLARAVFHIHPETHQKIRLWFLETVYCSYLDRIIMSQTRQHRALSRLTGLIKRVSTSRFAPPGLTCPLHLYQRYLAYLERRLEYRLVLCHRHTYDFLPRRNDHMELIDTCLALTLYYQILVDNNIKTGHLFPGLPQLAYLDLAFYFSPKTQGNPVKNMLLRKIKSSLGKENSLERSIAVADDKEGKRIPRNLPEWLNSYRALLNRIIKIREEIDVESRNRAFLFLKGEVEFILTKLPVAELSWNFSASRQLDIDTAPQIYFLCTWAGFLKEFHGEVDPGLMRSLLAPAATFRGGAHALHLQLLLAKYTGMAAGQLESNDYLDTQQAIHAYFGRTRS